MGLSQWISNIFSKDEQSKVDSVENVAEDSKVIESSVVNSISSEVQKIDEVEFEDLKFEDGEKEEVAAVFAACLSGGQTNVKYKIKSITKIDPDLEACAAIAASCFAGERDGIKLSIKNIYRVK